jgi:Mg2+ and Co2+ transporter CorA
MSLTYDDMTLITAADDGTLIIWSILNTNGKTAHTPREFGTCTDVLIAREDLIEKSDTIEKLHRRIRQQFEEFQYKMKQGDAFHSEQVRDIHKGYCDAIEELKKKNDEMEMAHLEEFNMITSNIAQTKEDHQKEMMALEGEFHDKIIIEYEKLSMIKNKMDAMREDYEVRLVARIYGEKA